MQIRVRVGGGPRRHLWGETRGSKRAAILPNLGGNCLVHPRRQDPFQIEQGVDGCGRGGGGGRQGKSERKVGVRAELRSRSKLESNPHKGGR